MKGAEVNLRNKNAELNGNNVKPEIFACPLFHEFCELSKFAKITGNKYSNGNQLFSTSLVEARKKCQN